MNLRGEENAIEEEWRTLKSNRVEEEKKERNPQERILTFLFSSPTKSRAWINRSQIVNRKQDPSSFTVQESSQNKRKGVSSFLSLKLKIKDC